MDNHRQLLSKDELSSILDANARYRASAGKEGEKLDLLMDIAIQGQSLKKQNLIGAFFRNSSFIECDFSGADLYGIDVSRCEFINCDFTKAWLAKADIHNSNLSRSRFHRATCIRLFFDSCELNNVTFRETTIQAVSFNYCDLRTVDFSGATIKGVDLFGCITDGSSLVGHAEVQIKDGISEPPPGEKWLPFWPAYEAEQKRRKEERERLKEQK